MRLRNLSIVSLAFIPTPALATTYICEACPAGTWGDGTNCNTCKAGTYAYAGASSCTNCLTTGVKSCDSKTGKATSCKSGFGLLSSGACARCSAGTYSPGGTGGCYSCSSGYYSYAGASKCTACTNKPSNSSYTSNSTSNSCSWSCNSGYIKSGSQCCSTKTVYVYTKEQDCRSFGFNPCSGYTGSAYTSCTLEKGSGGGSYECGPEYYEKIGEISYTKSLNVGSISGLYYSTVNGIGTSEPTYSPSLNTSCISWDTYGNCTEYSIRLNCSQ